MEAVLGKIFHYFLVLIAIQVGLVVVDDNPREVNWQEWLLWFIMLYVTWKLVGLLFQLAQRDEDPF